MSEASEQALPVTRLVVAEKKQIAEGIFSFELRDPERRELLPFTPGAHVTVRTPSGANRNYSLSNDPAERDRYVIAIKRDASGRGGSMSMADDLDTGSTLELSAPRNEFELNAHAKSYIFVAGGIGITPILSMMRFLKATNEASFKLFYCTRSPELTAFRDELSAPEWSSHVTIHHDFGDIEKSFDFWPVFEKPANNTHVYCCGPRPLMDAVKDMTGHWPEGRVHFESFGVDQALVAQNQPFRVTLQRSGQSFDVPKDRSILEILRDHGIRAPSSCESGTCGSCRTGLCSGDVDHRDMVLAEDEKASQIMICVSRAKGGELVVDL